MTRDFIPDKDLFLPYMRDVLRSEQSLRELNLMWRMIESSARMNALPEIQPILQTMAATRSGFDRLEQELVSSLVREKLVNILIQIGTKAHYVIDIVVRNLYERTADVGFLATDSVLCEFLANERNATVTKSVKNRLIAYRNKYTVYDEIMLLDTEGRVLLQLDEFSETKISFDPLIAQTLASTSYVEIFRATDLRPGKQNALIYSQRILHPQNGEVIGILCLCFDFENEMVALFNSHRDPDARSNMLLLDGQNRVIASADTAWIPPGSIVPVNRDASMDSVMFGGRPYLIRTFCAEGYQNYMGPPGWQGQVMIPVEIAFSGGANRSSPALDACMIKGLLAHAQTFSPPLYEIMQAAKIIRRVVWNGQVMTAGHSSNLLQLKSVLEQISETGNRSNELFSHSIDHLYETVLGSSLREAEFMSHLLVDLLDRNLYERSNDCRWWALTPALGKALQTSSCTGSELEEITAILEYINSLYTVYTRIFVYDRSGRIIACTNPVHAPDNAVIIGTAIERETLEAVLALSGDQAYFVSPFVRSALYSNMPTYVYHAAIRQTDDSRNIAGGIGIVFDATPQLSAMLHEGLNGKAGTTACFIDRSGTIIASTDPLSPVGAKLGSNPAVLRLPKGGGMSGIVIHNGHYASMGATVSSGYREFKVSDGYEEDIIAVVFESFGEVRDSSAAENRISILPDDRLATKESRQFATFFINGSLFSVPAESVVEALPATGIFGVSMNGRPGRAGMLQVRHANGDPQMIWVYDLGFMVGGKVSDIGQDCQVVIVGHQQGNIGLLVDDLHSVAEFGIEHIVA
ncbi:MAG TPA: chemotaxis protein CheW, partial [Burkholderiales bacterium]|nr:chemotaxis protein CheW [Burkholderiales bacterium]